MRSRRWRASRTDRPRLAGTGGLVFWRLLGTGRGRNTGFGVDPRRTALFALWESDAALDAFLAGSAIARRWETAQESYTVRLHSLGGHGSWCGVDVLGGMVAAATVSGPVAVLTRAVVRTRRWGAFMAAGRTVSRELADAAGLLAVAGVGEAPLGRQATFSLWTDLDRARAVRLRHAGACGHRPSHSRRGLVRRAAVRPFPPLRQPSAPGTATTHSPADRSAPRPFRGTAAPADAPVRGGASIP